MNYTYLPLTYLIAMWDWDVFSTISNIFLVSALVIVNIKYLKQMKKQTEFMKIDRYVKEMDNLVAPLYFKKDDPFIFTKKNFGYPDRRGKGVPEYLDYWENIKQYKYLGSAELRSAVDNYLKSKSDEKDESYAKAKKELVEVIENRYSELGIIIRNSEEKV